jgi:hypothetical protein
MTTADWRLFEQTPKTVLYVMAKHLAAASDGDSYDDSIDSGTYLERMRYEWELLHANGLVPQRPLKVLP